MTRYYNRDLRVINKKRQLKKNKNEGEGRKPEILGLNAKKEYVYIKLPSLKKQIECSHLLAMFGQAKKEM